MDGDLFLWGNASLLSVSDLDGIQQLGGDLNISNDTSLGTDAAEALRDAIGTDNIGGTITIAGNE